VTEPSSAALSTPAPVATRPAAQAPVGFTSTDVMLSCMVLVWGVNYIVIKAAMREITPLAFNAVRFALAAATVALIAWLHGAKRPTRADLGRLVLLGVLGNTIYQYGFVEGVAHTRAGNAALLFAAVPIQTAVLSHLGGHERLRLRDVIGLLVSVAGIAVIVLGSRTGAQLGGTVRGDVLIIAATVCWSFYVVGVKPLLDRYGAITTTAWTMGLGAIPLVLYSIPAMRAQQWRGVSTSAWGALFLSSMGALVIAYLIWFRGVRRLGPARTAIYSNVTPVVTMLAAWPMLGERPTPWQLLGAAGIFGGLWLTRT
jgi:drug/metabolite transporter (DMT)-like permease